MDNLKIIDLEELLINKSSYLAHDCGPSHSCGGGG
ncbi:streptosactin [Streptococcus caprae]|uniref:Bacteriocin n=1 Tax=Streptococcus rupicaprae TaxID=759619 RepID=A0ABV2FEL6_9STRE